MPAINLPNKWSPRPYQRAAWDYLEKGGKRACLVWHRRSGKDSLVMNRTAVAAFERVGSYWHMLPMANQARKAVWTAVNPHTGARLIDQAFPHEIREATNDQEMFIRFKNQSTWQLVGSDNFDSLVGSPPAGLGLSEYALSNPRAWGILRPILLENNGWAAFFSTPRGRNHLKNTYELSQTEPGWFGEILPATKTGVFTPEQLEQERREYIKELGPEDGDALFRQEYLCSFDAAIVGSYYGKMIEQAEAAGRIGNIPWEPQLPVHTWWDLGVNDSTVIWFAQYLNREIRLIDHYSASGAGLEHYAKVLKEKPYVYGRHVLPHDVEVTELGSGKSRYGMLLNLGVRPITVCKRHEVEDGINAVRANLNRCYFDQTKCALGIEGLRQYRREWNDKLKAFKDNPLHDWCSDHADAFRYGIYDYRPSEVQWVQGKPVFISENRPTSARMD